MYIVLGLLAALAGCATTQPKPRDVIIVTDRPIWLQPDDLERAMCLDGRRVSCDSEGRFGPALCVCE